MSNYEACVILNAQLTDAQHSALIDKMKDTLTAGGAQIKEISKWGKRKLAYEINKAYEGYYVVFYFDLEKAGDTLTNFQRLCKYDENVYREMIINVPVKKKGREIRQIVPTPGWLAEFSMKLRPSAPRRRSDFHRGPRPYHQGPPQDEAQDGGAAAAAPVATVEAGEARPESAE